jgi:hypothetical protein
MTTVSRSRVEVGSADDGVARLPGPGRIGFAVLSAVTAASLGAAVAWGPVALALLALVAAVPVLLWLLRVPTVLACCTIVLALGAAWSGVLDLYDRLAWLDVVAHAAVQGVLATALVDLAVRRGVLRPGPRAAAVLVSSVVALGLAVGAAWEILEWAGHTYVDPGVGVGYDDTIGDIAAGALGAAVGGAWLIRRFARRRTST